MRLQDVPASATLQESSNGQLIPLGAAVRVRNRDVDPWWAFRADLRDNVIFLDVPDPVSGRVDQEPRHNWEISAGISFLFGGAASSPVAQPGVARAAERPAAGQAQEPAPRPAGGPAPGPSGDADRDSVPDRLDRCAATPRELAVGPTGCPVDLDRDGAPDRRTAQIAEEPKARPIRPGPEAARRPGAAEGVRPGPPEDAAPAEDAARGVAPAAEKAAASPTACLDHRRWGRPGISIAFDERLWDQLGAPEPISLENLEPVGEFDGVPIYVGTLAREPYSELWVPRCDPAGTFQLYVEEGKAE